MADAKKNFADLNDDTQFLVDLSAPVPVGRSWARPGLRTVMKGRVIKEHAQHVVDVRPLAD